MNDDQPGVKVTLDTIYNMLLDLDKKVDPMRDHGERIRKVELQISAQWVIVGIVIAGIGGLLVRAITGA